MAEETASRHDALGLILGKASDPALTLQQVQVELGRAALLRIAMQPETVSLTQIGEVLKGLAETEDVGDDALTQLKNFFTGGDDAEEGKEATAAMGEEDDTPAGPDPGS